MAQFYRVASTAEYEDIRATGRMRAVPNSTEGKHLWLTLDHARMFRDLLIKQGWETERIILLVQVPSDCARRFEKFPAIDGIGPACFAEIADLDGATVRDLGQ